jgi:hypothetical protein
MYRAAEVTVTLAATPEPASFALAREVVRDAMATTGTGGEAPRQLVPLATWTALDRADVDHAEPLAALLEDQPPGHVPPSLRAHLAGLRGGLAAQRGDDETAERELATAVEALGALGQPYWQARAETAFAAWLLEHGRGSEAAPVLDHAATVLQELGAAPALDRVLRLRDEQPQDAISA